MALAGLVEVRAVASAGFAVPAWVRGWWTVPLRVHYSVTVLSLVAFAAAAWYYNLMGWPVFASW